MAVIGAGAERPKEARTLGVGLAVLVGSAVRLRSVGDGIGSAFFLLRARWLNPVAPKLLYGCITVPRAYRYRGGT